MNIARTGLDEHQRFLDSVRAYWPIWNNWSDSKIREEPESGPPGSKLNLGDMPQFNYAAEHVSSSIKRAFIDFGIMCFMIILFFSGAYWSFTKYDVR
jgi:hypothetical protein